MNLTHLSDTINWPVTHYLFVEKIGPFQATAQLCWKLLHEKISSIPDITGKMALYKFDPEMVYRAGVSVSEAPKEIPEGLQYVKFEGGHYTCFTLKGSYSNLPMASGRVYEIIEEKRIPRRNDYSIEFYVNDPNHTPEDRLITQILVPTF